MHEDSSNAQGDKLSRIVCVNWRSSIINDPMGLVKIPIATTAKKKKKKKLVIALLL